MGINMNLSLKKCSLKDIEILRDISIKTYYATFAEFNVKENMNAYLDAAFNFDKLFKEAQDKNSAFYFLYKDNVLTGYIKLNVAPSQSDINDSDSLEIERIYILKEFQGFGLGRFLIEHAIKIAIEKRKKFIWLGVWENNEKAIRFYKKNGFYKIGSHSFFMGEDGQIDYVMRKDI